MNIHTRKEASQLAEANAVPSGESFILVTLFSCPYNKLTLSHFKLSQAFIV